VSREAHHLDTLILFKGFILGLVEGITEFIPVSSTGHLILIGDLLGFDDERAKVFEISIQLGAILSVVWLYREKLSGVIRDLSRRREARQFLLNLGVAFLPAAFIGLLSHQAIKTYLFNPITVSIALIGGGAAILLIERMKHRNHVGSTDDLTLKQALGIGIAQCLALFPGVSRSGATIMGGLMIGLERKVATEFSFFLAIPTMFAATTFDLFKNRQALSASDTPLFIVGFITAFISALVVVKAFIGYVSKRDFSAFAYYRIIFGLMVLTYYWENGWKF
jgi:undecaprenyl-diphosphatase